MAIKIDVTDQKILMHLQENGKTTNLDLAERIGLSPASTLERVKKLEKAEIISGYKAIINPQSVNMGCVAFVFIRIKGGSDKFNQQFMDCIQDIKFITDCYRISGKYDYLIKVTTVNSSHFEKDILIRLSKESWLDKMESLVVLSTTFEKKPISITQLS